MCLLECHTMCKRECATFKQACLVFETICVRYLLNLWQRSKSGYKIGKTQLFFQKEMILNWYICSFFNCWHQFLWMIMDVTFKVVHLCLEWHDHFWYAQHAHHIHIIYGCNFCWPLIINNILSGCGVSTLLIYIDFLWTFYIYRWL